MAKGWRKDDYNRESFGQQVKAYRQTLHWSFGQLALLSGLNKGTLQHVEKGEAHLPASRRQALIDVLAEALQDSGQSANRQELLDLSGFPTTSRVLNPLSSPHLQSREIPGANSREKSWQHRSHEEYAEFLNQQDEWQLAGTYWLLAAHEGEQVGDWAKWSRCLIRAGLMALTCGQFEIAERRFKEIIHQSQHEVSIAGLAEAYIRLGWAYYERDRFSEAEQALLKSGALLRTLASKNAEPLRFSQHGSILHYEGRELIVALEATRSHWLGRTYVDWGIQQDNPALIKQGLEKLQKNRQYDNQLGHHGNVGFALLRQVPALLYQGELATTEKYLAQSEELIDPRGTARGHLSLHKGLVALEEQPEKAKDLLENARAGFVQPMFYSRGISETFKEMSSLYLMDERKSGDERAVEYALVSAILHPYGRNLELLQLAAHKLYWRMGENRRAFDTFWQALEEKLWSMESEPFSDFRHLMNAFRDSGIDHIESALTRAKKTVQSELYNH